MNLETIAAFKKGTKAQVVAETDAAYESLRNSNNRAASPVLVVVCSEAEQIAQAVVFARDNGLTLSVRSGGHGFHGKSSNDGGLVVDLGGMRGIEFLDKDRTRVRVEAGARWGEVAAALAPYRLAISSGDTKQVGVGGLTLGGGIGWMVRKHGLTIDSLVAAEIVTAEGKLLRVSAGEHPELFWALRGGAGNFGVVTAFEFKTSHEPELFNFEIVFDMADRAAVIEAWAEYMRDAPDALSSTVTIFPGIAPFRPQPELRISSCFAGPEDEARKSYLALSTIATVVSTDFRPVAYADMLHDAPPRNPAFKGIYRSGFVPALDKVLVSAIAASSGESGKPVTQIRALGGAAGRIASDATAFAHRDAEAMIIVICLAPASTDETQVVEIADSMWKPYADYSEGTYLNFHSDTGANALRGIYPAKTLARLREVKRTYDPGNLFTQTHALPR